MLVMFAPRAIRVVSTPSPYILKKSTLVPWMRSVEVIL